MRICTDAWVSHPHTYARSFILDPCLSLLCARKSPASPTTSTTVERFFNMHPQRPLPQAMPMPPNLGQTLRDAALGIGRGKNLLGGNIAYGLIQSLKECLYFLLCCWCIKEILD
ncbi:lens epithelial cell protein LEP503 [Engraulis encrasicolus]|uniref:lens epithelial cell protein LEP503 n=1 Tax=Engraulis encrasicolus TaxID=184585 RepID=UPI002FD0DA2A